MNLETVLFNVTPFKSERKKIVFFHTRIANFQKGEFSCWKITYILNKLLLRLQFEHSNMDLSPFIWHWTAINLIADWRPWIWLIVQSTYQTTGHLVNDWQCYQLTRRLVTLYLTDSAVNLMLYLTDEDVNLTCIWLTILSTYQKTGSSCSDFDRDIIDHVTYLDKSIVNQSQFFIRVWYWDRTAEINMQESEGHEYQDYCY